jgi:hypothetical protein
VLTVIDWSELVADATQNPPKNEAKGPSSDSTCRNKPDFSESVGTAETRANTGIYVVSSDIPTVPSDFERQRVSKQEKTILCHLLKPAGVVVMVNLRRIKQPSKRHAGHAPTCAALASLTACAAAVRICPTPSHLATLCAAFLTMAGAPAPPGHFMNRW